MADYDEGNESDFSQPESTEDRMADISSGSENDRELRDLPKWEGEVTIGIFSFDRREGAVLSVPAEESETTLTGHIDALHLSNPPALPGSSTEDDGGDERKMKFKPLCKKDQMKPPSPQPGTSKQGCHLFYAESMSISTASDGGSESSPPLPCNPWKDATAMAERAIPGFKPEEIGAAAALPKPGLGRGWGRGKKQPSPPTTPRSSRSRSPLLRRESSTSPPALQRPSMRRRLYHSSDPARPRAIRQRSPTPSSQFWQVAPPLVPDSIAEAEASSSAQPGPSMPQCYLTGKGALRKRWVQEKRGGVWRKWPVKRESEDDDTDDDEAFNQ